MNTQKERIFKHLRNGNSITQLEAIKHFGAMRLSAIIFNIRNAGWAVEKRWETDNVGSRYAVYSMPSKLNRKYMR